MPSLLSKRNYGALGALSCVVALYFALNDPVAVRQGEEDAAAARRRELVSNAGDTCTPGYAGGDLSTVQPFAKPAPVSHGCCHFVCVCASLPLLGFAHALPCFAGPAPAIPQDHALVHNARALTLSPALGPHDASSFFVSHNYYYSIFKSCRLL